MIRAFLLLRLLRSESPIGANFSEALLEGCRFKRDHRNPEENDKNNVIWKASEDPNWKDGQSREVVRFDGAKITGKNVVDRERYKHKFIEPNFNGFDLSGASFIKAQITCVYFNGTNLSKAIFLDAKLEKVDFTGSTLVEAVFGKDKEGMPPANLKEGTKFVGAILKDAHLEGVVFTNIELTGADLTNAHCSNSIFRNAQLNGTNFTGTILEGVKFVNCEVDDKTQLPNRTTGAEILEKVFNIKLGADEEEVNYLDFEEALNAEPDLRHKLQEAFFRELKQINPGVIIGDSPNNSNYTELPASNILVEDDASYEEGGDE